jgi:hypothetical protein
VIAVTGPSGFGIVLKPEGPFSITAGREIASPQTARHEGRVAIGHDQGGAYCRKRPSET